MQIFTLEGQVPENCWDDLKRAFAYAMKDRPTALLWSFLTQDALEPTVWRVMTAWESREAAQAYAAAHDDGMTPSTFPFLVVSVTPEASMGTVLAAAPGRQLQTTDGTTAE
jgi:hypothetical protein